MKFVDPKTDIAFKKIFGNEAHKNVLIEFLNEMLELDILLSMSPSQTATNRQTFLA